jgi:DNA-binding NtrC family response regulator
MSAPVFALVVDDEPAVASLVGAFLRRLGLAVTIAHSFAEADSLLAGDTAWALMVTDLQLGGAAGEDGMRLLELCRARHPGCRSILISGSAGPQTGGQAQTCGAALFLGKPISFAELSAAVGSLGLGSLGV